MQTKRTIRKLPRRASNALDERAGSVQWMLGIWAALLTVLVVLLGGFDDTRLLYNGWVRLLAVGATWSLLAWAAATPGEWMAQRLRLAAAASLTLHTLVALLLVFTHLRFLVTEPVVDMDRQVVVQPKEVPQLVEVVRPTSSDEPVFEKPVPTDRLAEQQRPQTEAKKASPTEVNEPNLDPPELATSEAPQSLVERRPRTALTHRARTPGERSRQMESAMLASRAPRPVDRPAETPTAAAEATPATKLARATPTPTVDPMEDPPEVPTPTPTQLARRDRSDAPRLAEATPQARRAASPAEAVEQAVAEAEPQFTAPESNRLAAEPTRLERPKAQQRAREDVPEPQEERPAPSSAVARRDTREAEMPLAAAPTPLARRAPVQVADAAEQTPEALRPTEVTRALADVERSTEPVAAAIGERTTEISLSDQVADAEVEEESHQPPTNATNRRRPAARVAQVEVPTPRPTSSEEAELSPSEMNPDPLVAAVPRETTREASTSPAPRVLADSRGGTGTAGDGLNSLADTGAAPSYSAPFAAAAAKRPRSTQTERGPALVPNPVAEQARARAAAASPSSTLVALPVPDAEVAGSTTPEAISASSSAAVQKQFANVTLGDVTAAAGEAEFDTGPPQIAPERGSGRGTLGGRLAMRAPETKSGLGPRRLAQATMSPEATGVDPVPAAAAPAAAAGGAVARRESQAGGTPAPTVAGRPSRADAPRLAQSQAPTGASSGGGAAPPSAGPAVAATELGTLPPRSGGSTARRRESTSRKDGPSLATAGSPSAGPRSTGMARPAGLATAIDPVAVALTTPLAVDLERGDTTGTPPPSSTDATAELPKRSTLMPADVGAGGLADEPSLDAGLPQRIARRQTRDLRMTPSRFANRSEGGDLVPPGRERNPAPAFAARTDRADSSPVVDPSDPRPKTEAAIELGLEFLARLQRRDGSWSLNEFGDLPISEDEQPSIRADGAATGLALLAFLGGGYDHYDDKYQAVVQRGLDYLVREQSERGDIFPERDLPGPRATRFYSHGIATLALCEAYGMTGDPELQVPAQVALDYIAEMQHPRLDGWRYTEGTNSDLSVTGWQVMALRSGQLAGLRVDQRTYARVKKFVEACRQTAGGGALYCYNPYLNSTREGMQHYDQPSTVMTSVGMLMQLYLGANRDSPLMQQGAAHLRDHLPTQTGKYRLVPVGTPGNPQRDTYYWYYATQVMFHMGGDYWQAWHESLHPLLVQHQTQEGPLAGSWNPQKPVPDMWAGHAGRLYVTCLNLLSLEVSYRHLPLYEMTGK